MWINASESSVLISQIVGELRDKETSAASFRICLKKLGNYSAYEASKHFDTKKISINTPFGKAEHEKINNEIVVISILRAALPMSEGVLEVLPESAVGVIAASRGAKLKEDGTDFRIDCTYSNIPYLEDKIAIIVDPMIASGSTLAFVLDQIVNQKPHKIIILCAIASEYGIQRIQEQFPESILIAGSVDKELNEKGYIVPGLGDAGDRAFNT